MRNGKRVTITDVAKAAHVSATTVSHALNNKGNVSPETAARVRKIAVETGYRPSAIARRLQGSQFGVIAICIRPFQSLDTYLPAGVDQFIRLIGAASLEAMQHGYSLLFIDVPTLPDAPLSALAADAYIVVQPFENDPVLTLLAESNLPFVTLGQDSARPGEFFEIPDGTRANAELLAHHLEAAGARRIAAVSGTDANIWNGDARDYMLEWWHERGQTPLFGSMPEAEGESVGDAVLDHFFAGDGDTPDAILCFSGRHASGVASAALRRGIRVPEDLMIAALAGTMKNRMSRPGITSLDLNPEEFAQQAVIAAISLAEKQTAVIGNTPAATLHILESTTRAS